MWACFGVLIWRWPVCVVGFVLATILRHIYGGGEVPWALILVQKWSVCMVGFMLTTILSHVCGGAKVS